MQTENKQPKVDWRELAKQRLYDIVRVDYSTEPYIISSASNPVNFMRLGVIYDAETAKYVAMAVNNLHKVAEALEGLLSSYRADFKTITGADLNDTESVKAAKQALAAIS